MSENIFKVLLSINCVILTKNSVDVRSRRSRCTRRACRSATELPRRLRCRRQQPAIGVATPCDLYFYLAITQISINLKIIVFSK